MLRFVAIRAAQSIVTLLLISIAVFVLSRATGDATALSLPLEATDEQRQEFIRGHGLDQPLPIQYWAYLRDAVGGDFGTSLRTGQPVMGVVAGRFGNSLLLATAAMLVAVFISVPLGVVAATQRGRAWETVAMVFALIGQSVPSFFMGILAVLLFAVVLRWLPAGGSPSPSTLVLPAVVLGWAISAGVVRLLRASMIEVLESEFVKFAHSKGLAERTVIWKHAVRNALIPVVTFVGLMYGVLIAAAVVVEVVFAWPGLGQLAYQAVLWRDFPLLQAIVLVWAAAVMIVNFAIDVLYVVLDPRVRL